MSRSIVQACLLAAGVAGCSVQSPQPADPLGASATGERIQWQGIAPCADCDGIQTDLLLEQADGKRRYTLTESYLAGSDSRRFVERGDWQRSAGLLRLDGDGASVRVYGLLPDGRLQARDRHGEPLPAAADDALRPVAISSTD